MRAFIFLTLVAVISAELCRTDRKGAKADQKRIAEIKATVRTAATMLVGGSCPKMANTIDKVLFAGACRNVAKQGMCYGMRVKERYAGSTMISYGQLASGIDDLAEMGNLVCAEGVACLKQVTKVVKRCIRNNENFVSETIAAAEVAYHASAQAKVEAFVDEHAQSSTLFGELANLAMGEFNSAADIKNFINKYVSSDMKEKIKSDAAAAAEEVTKLAKNFCKGGCTDKTAAFVKALFEGMHNGQCVDASKFCGPCKDNAHNVFEAGNSIPCCLNKVIVKAIQAYDYVAESYGDQIDEWVGVVSDELSDAANERAAEIRDEIIRQAECIGEAYNDHIPKCKSRA